MGNSNNFIFCNYNTADNSNQQNLGTYINYPNDICFCCNKNTNNEVHQEDLSHNISIGNNINRSKKFIDINNNKNKNNLIENEENKNNNQNNDYNNNKDSLQNNNNIFNNNNYNQENNIPNLNNSNNAIRNYNNIDNDNRNVINESILSFRDKIFPKIPKIRGPFTYIILPGKKGSFVRNVTENITFIDEGQFIQVEIDIVIINLPQNQSSISYGISFESQIFDVHCNLENNYEYDSKHIKFYFNLKNNESIHISFDYKKYNQNICEYYRSEFILISNIFSGAVGTYKVTIPQKYILICQENDLFYQEDKNTYIWKGVIPNDGLKEWFKISYRKAKWEAEMHQYIESKNL